MREGFLWKPPLLLLSPLLTLLSPGVLTRSGVRDWSILSLNKVVLFMRRLIVVLFHVGANGLLLFELSERGWKCVPIRFRTTIEIIVLIMMPKFSSLFFTDKKLIEDGLINSTQNKSERVLKSKVKSNLEADLCFQPVGLSIQFQTLIPSTNSAYPARGCIKLSINA